MADPRTNNIGAFINVTLPILAAAAAAEVDGAAINLTSPGNDFQSGVLGLQIGTPAGAPSSFSVIAKIQTSADGLTNWTDLTYDGTRQIGKTAPIVAANGYAYTQFNLAGALPWIRAVVLPTFVGGTSPTLPLAAALVLGGSDELPSE